MIYEECDVDVDVDVANANYNWRHVGSMETRRPHKLHDDSVSVSVKGSKWCTHRLFTSGAAMACGRVLTIYICMQIRYFGRFAV
jgi:hypothetical protein